MALVGYLPKPCLSLKACLTFTDGSPDMAPTRPRAVAGTFAWASDTLSVRPSISQPFIFVIALAASCWSPAPETRTPCSGPCPCP